MNLEKLINSLDETEIAEISFFLESRKREESLKDKGLFKNWVEEHKDEMPINIYRSFMRVFNRLEPYFCQRKTLDVDARFIHKFRGMGLISVEKFLGIFPQFNR